MKGSKIWGYSILTTSGIAIGIGFTGIISHLTGILEGSLFNSITLMLFGLINGGSFLCMVITNKKESTSDNNDCR